ncbi:MAG TPA: FAD binding domain-containing protein [Solirubrobacteraceae bacterium]|jgi:carbon-monoxide dehydrogenase medium subunit|nr:FAD binding domain-containing protein [Solirubrobacteraceae bacterium]
MTGGAPAVEWLAPRSLEHAAELRVQRGAEATVLAGGSFLGILMNQGFIEPRCLLSLRDVPELRSIAVRDAELCLGAMVTHRQVERDATVCSDWPVLARAFGLVASPRVRNQATVGGVLADADYASDPPAVLCALNARAVLRGPGGEREVPIDELILGFYETCIADDELLTEVRVPAPEPGAVYRKFRSRSTEDRPCVAVAAARTGGALRVVVGACAEVPQHYRDICAAATELNGRAAAEIAAAYAERLQPLSDSRGSAEYRRRVVTVELRRALEELAGGSGAAARREGA